MSYDNEKDSFTRGYVHVYTGNGKGKTTSAIGLSIRALGAGLRVFFAQFLKSGRYSETNILANMPGLTYRQYGTGGFIAGKPTEEDARSAALGLREAREAIKNGEYNLVVLDEANVACLVGLLREDDLLALIHDKPCMVELAFTGRGAPEKLIEAADLVTEMREIKHYFAKGVKARRGIES
jgi:cob(I)alamin adenosyltransferase